MYIVQHTLKIPLKSRSIKPISAHTHTYILTLIRKAYKNTEDDYGQWCPLDTHSVTHNEYTIN